MEKVERKFNVARIVLLLAVVMTVANIVLFAIWDNSSFMFTAFTPIIALYNYSTDGTVSSTGIISALFLVAIFLGCYFLSKRYKPFMLVALILFLVDTFVLVNRIISVISDDSHKFDFSMMAIVMFHAFVLYYLVSGTIAWVKLKKLSQEEEIK